MLRGAKDWGPEWLALRDQPISRANFFALALFPAAYNVPDQAAFEIGHERSDNVSSRRFQYATKTTAKFGQVVRKCFTRRSAPLFSPVTNAKMAFDEASGSDPSRSAACTSTLRNYEYRGKRIHAPDWPRCRQYDAVVETREPLEEETSACCAVYPAPGTEMACAIPHHSDCDLYSGSVIGFSKFAFGLSTLQSACLARYPLALCPAQQLHHNQSTIIFNINAGIYAKGCTKK
ncbi:hypothetical protein EJ07DRAFT_156105 [Lizonia empirigonia]|nr:hypothetical protein EJ07DRAFT_156105 [Lizonia empirigonia]